MKKFVVKVYAKIGQTINFPRRAKLLQQFVIMQKLIFYNIFFIMQKFMVKIWIWPPLNLTPLSNLNQKGGVCSGGDSVDRSQTLGRRRTYF